MEEILDRLSIWCSENYLDVKQDDVSEHLFLIPDFGKFLFVMPKDNKIIVKGCMLNMDEDDMERFNVLNPDYLLFEFGRRWYYTKPVAKSTEYDGDLFEANFTDFKFLGKATVAIDNMPFVHFGVHSEYELLNGSGKADIWCSKAKFLGQDALAICDKQTLAGTITFQLSCDTHKIKSILGETLPIAHNYDADKEHQITFDVKLYVKNHEGWINLIHLNNMMNTDYNGHFITEKDLFARSEGLVLVFPKESILNNYIDTPVVFKKIVQKYQKYFEDVYYQIDSVEYYDDKTDIAYLTMVKKYLSNCKKFIKPILISDSYYIEKEHFEIKEGLNKIDGKPSKYSEDEYFKPLDEVHERMSPLFKDEDVWLELFSEMCDNTVELSELCKYKIEIGKPRLPKYEFVEGMTNEEFFRELIVEGVEKKLIKRGNTDRIDEYLERIERELDVIIPAGITDYFLILWDIISWAKDNGIMVGNGRGSVGGSLVAYLCDITDIDPIQYDLMFERFLNKTRVMPEEYIDVVYKDGSKKTLKGEDITDIEYEEIKDKGGKYTVRKEFRKDSLPDIDVDFPSEYRDVIKQYIKERFGELQTCSVGTYTKLQLKAGLKDFGKFVGGYSFDYLNAVTKAVDDQVTYTWKDLFKYALDNKELYKFCQENPNIVNIIKFTLEQPRACSVHASAVLVLPNENDGKKVDLNDWLPLRQIDGMLVSEWEGKYTDRAGFVKEDILGLTQLDKFMSILKMIKDNRGKTIKLHKIPMDDENVYGLFSKGYNDDIFQFNKSGIKQYSRKVKPDNIEDIIAMNALWRPGTMVSNAHIDFAEIKHGKKKAKYDYMLKEVTEHTNGLYVYQEQIMQAVVVLGGFSLVESDTFRSAIKKFDNKTMKSYEDKFIQGAIKNGCDQFEAVKIWNKLLAFAGYGFNRAHSAAYGVMAYWAQWFKWNYPLEFWTTALQYADASKGEIVHRISEMNKLKQGIDLKPPSVNISTEKFECSIENMSIYWSLAKIKGIGTNTVNKIIEERNKNGVFSSYNDLTARVPKKYVNKAHLAALIVSGAFDEVEGIENPEGRKELLIRHYQKFSEDIPEIYRQPDSTKRHFWIFQQKNLTGFGEIDYKKMLISGGYKMQAGQYVNPDKFFKSADYTQVSICGVLQYFNERKTKAGKLYCVMELICNNDIIIITFWEEEYLKIAEDLMDLKNKVVCINGKTKHDDWKNTVVLYANETTKVIKL